MDKKTQKALDLPLLEGGGGGGGYRTRWQERMDAMSPKERAALENPGKQFESARPAQPKAMDKARQERLDAMSPKERAELENVGEQFRTKPEAKKKGGMISASKRADGIAQRGKTRGKVI
jgi:hypothetical protein